MIFGGACPVGCRLTVPLWCPQGGLAFFAACLPRRLLAFLPPIPPTPFPGGKGEIFTFHMQGASPLASPRLRRRRHGLNLRCRCPLGGLPGWSPADLAAVVSAGVAEPQRHLLALPRGRGPSQTPPSRATDSSISPGPPSPWLPALLLGKDFCRFCTEPQVPVRGVPAWQRL